jgi:murein tripeptide amidase MpaA
VQLQSIGKSHEGRDIWLVTVTNSVTGPADDKPALWVDGNIHAAELTASTACLYFLHQLATGADDPKDPPPARHARRLHLPAPEPRRRRAGAGRPAAPHPQRHAALPLRRAACRRPDGGGRRRRRPRADMRIPDPHGPYKKHPTDPRLMVAREPGEFGGSYYRVMPEGTLKNWDGLQIKVNKDREGLDLNRNFPAYWRQEFEQAGAGPYPTSEPEVRAMVDFITKPPQHRRGVSFHTHSGVILRPMGTQSDDDMTPEDLWMYKRLSDIGAKLTGYPAISIFHDFKYHPKEVITGTQDWVYEHLGALFWTVEIWAPNKEAGITDYQWIEWYRDHPVEDDLKLLKWSDEQCGGQAHVDWYPFRHPQLGMVELGGWDRMNYWRNPPPHLREREAARFPAG